MPLIVFFCLFFYCLCYQEAQKYANDNGLLFKETSAKLATNVMELFKAIGEFKSISLTIRQLLKYYK